MELVTFLKNTKEGLGWGKKEAGNPLEGNLGYYMEDLAHKQTTEPASSALSCGHSKKGSLWARKPAFIRQDSDSILSFQNCDTQISLCVLLHIPSPGWVERPLESKN